MTALTAAGGRVVHAVPADVHDLVDPVTRALAMLEHARRAVEPRVTLGTARKPTNGFPMIRRLHARDDPLAGYTRRCTGLHHLARVVVKPAANEVEPSAVA